MPRQNFRRAIRLHINNGIDLARTNRCALDVESLESRTLLSSTVAGNGIKVDPAAAAAIVVARAAALTPLLQSAAPVDNTSVRVSFSKALTAVYAAKIMFRIPGLTIDTHTLAADGKSMLLKTTAQTATTYTLTITSDGTTATSASFGSVTFVGIAPPLLKTVVPVDNTSVLISFTRSVTAAYAAKLVFSIPSLTIGARTLAGDGMSIVLKTSSQKIQTYTVTITSDGTTAPGSTFGRITFVGLPTAILKSAAAVDNTSVRINFTRSVTAAYAAKLVFSIPGLTIGTRTLASDGLSIVLKTTAQGASTYIVTVTSDGSTAPSGSFGKVSFVGVFSPLLQSAAVVSSTSVIVNFTRAITPAYAANLKFSIPGLTVVSAALASDGLSIVLTTSTQGLGPYRVTVLTDGTSAPSSSFGSATFGPGPQLFLATATSSTSVTLTFRGPVGSSALSPSAYKIDKLDSAGNVIGSLAVTAAAFADASKTIVNITTATQSASQFRVTTTSTLLAPTGLAVPSAQVNFQGIPVPSVLGSAASTGYSTAVVKFSLPMSDDALLPSAYVIKDASGTTLPVLIARFIGTDRRTIELTTTIQAAQKYTILSITATGTNGGAAVVPTTVNTFLGQNVAGGPTPVAGAPRVVGAVSLSNTEVLVSFSEPMADSAIRPEFYFIVQQNVSPESGYLQVTSAIWFDPNHSVVKLTTRSQNELTYSVTAVIMTDLAGNALAPPLLGLGGIVIDPRTAQFPGTPPGGGSTVDTDGDGLTDNVEMRGWTVTVQNVDGTTKSRTVTSDPTVADTDGDGLSDYQEANLRTDPRNVDTDDDQLNDYAEFNEIYSNPLSQDSDGDTLDDSLEVNFFKTSPIQADTDGDQLRDDYEIAANRNPRVADLPRPEITVGSVNLQLNVQFSETNDQQHRDLETRAVTSSLTQSANQTFTRSDTVNVEAHLEAGYGDGTDDVGEFLRAGVSAGYSFNQTSESSTSAEEAYQSSLSTDKEVTRGFTLQRNVTGAVMQVAIDLRNLSSLAYRVKNLQVTAFIQDPQDHTKLTPVATLLPDAEPSDGFTLGPLTPDKGPFIFSNSSIVPTLVESLMANSSGLIFRISNYDIIDESGRNFAFTSQQIVERTSRLVIDYGGASSLRALLGGNAFDELKPGDETEIYRVSTSAGHVIDTNFDGVIDGSDRRATFDANGKEVGVTLFEALSAVGLTQYDEATTPTGSLSQAQILGSYSTYIAPAEVIGGISYPAREKIYRIRGISNDSVNKKYWEISTAQGIDQASDVRDLVLKTNAPASLNFVQDLDKDGLSADVEYFLRTSDSPLPSGAEVPNVTDFRTNMSVTFSTDPGFATGAIVRVSETGGGLTADTNYFARSLGGGTYSFYLSAAGASAGGEIGRASLSGKITAGIFTASTPLATDTSPGAMSVSFAATPSSTDFTVNESISFATDPNFATGTAVQVTTTGAGLTAGTTYFVRKVGASTYAFYDSAPDASAGAGTSGRINLAGNVTAGIQRTADRTFPTGTLVQVTETGGGLVVGTNYIIRNLGAGAYSFYTSTLDATAGSAITSGLVTLTGDVAAGIFSPTASGRDTDGDGLDDRYEALIGWTVTTPQRTYKVYSSPNRADSNFDAPLPGVDSDGDGIEDRIEYSGSDLFAAPAGWEDKRQDTNKDGVIDGLDAPANGLRDPFETFQLTRSSGETDYVLDPLRKDTDGDGIDDATEIIGFKITPITGAKPFYVTTNPTNPFTDSDTFSDGLERILGLDPTNGADTDADGDGLPDLVETQGWTVYTFGVSTTGYVQGAYAPGFDKHVTPTSTDLVTDAVRFTDAADPNVPRFTLVQVAGGGLIAGSPYYLGRLVVQPDSNSVQYGLYLSATDAAAGVSKGLADLKSAVTDIQLAREYNSVVPAATDLATDTVKFATASDPNVSAFTLVQVTGGGLSTSTNYYLGRLVSQPDPTTVRYGIYLTPSAAAAGTAGGSVHLTAPVTSIRLPASSHKTSQTNSVDSDSDGLTDYEEFFLGTDPSSSDSDHDGIDDRTEYLGYSLGHNVGETSLGIIKTNPLDADTDNDKRSDGAEAELTDVEQARWVVRVVGSTPYRVYSNPLVADSDFDSLVDGDEYAAGTDPYNGNTDGDTRSDDIEVKAGTNPLAADTQVTVVAQLFNDTGSQFTYNLAVRKPDTTGTGVAGLSATQTPVVSGDTNTAVGIGKVNVQAGALGFVGLFFYGWFDPGGGTVEHFTSEEPGLNAFQNATYNPGLKGVPVGARFRVYENIAGTMQHLGPSPDFTYTGGDTVAAFKTDGTLVSNGLLYLGATGDFALNQSLSFGLATGQHFSIEGFFTNTVTSQTVQLGGLSGVSALQVDPVSGSSKPVRTIFAYADVVNQFIQDYSFKVTMADGSIATLKFFYIVG